MKVYVAGASVEADIISGYMRRLRAAGHQITFDWTVPVLAAKAKDRDLSARVRTEAAKEDYNGIVRAERFWLIVPESKTAIGCWTELGLAVGARLEIVVSGDWRRSIFTEFATLRFDSHCDALSWFGAP